MDREELFTRKGYYYIVKHRTRTNSRYLRKRTIVEGCESQKPNYIQKKKEAIETPRHGDSQRRATEGE